ncbi:hypothetical protein SAMN05661080_04558 [Modestobacter sp. DSM 44400]|uniref:hypothetical protein n=1 Tax=Modestobacter sp. DSM 44400 TaxID=1550230 RepID=UPI000894E20A|nr:hypothetical protein [Modestobacter sp. DSM 44400]SDY77260.1 hypothetical protein SAMN05661080_04558 [Modestobacter sp. DSM 44400]
MTLPRRGRGRRDNGLDAALWSPLTDVDPRIGEHLLDLLATAGIAAYLEPATDVGPYTRTVFLPSPPSDRLFVDRSRRAEARELLARHGDPAEAPAPAPAPPPLTDDDLEFARIVAAFEAEHGPAPAARDEPRDDPPPPPAEPSVLDALDAADHYEPPPPPPLPVLSPATMYALLLLVVGVLLVFRPGTVGLSGDVGLVLGVAAVIGGVFVLVSRMRERSVDDGDDGAVV